MGAAEKVLTMGRDGSKGIGIMPEPHVGGEVPATFPAAHHQFNGMAGHA